MSESPTGIARRMLSARDTWWAIALTRQLMRLGVGPAPMAVLGAAFALGAGVSFYRAPLGGRPEIWWALGALGIQLRMLCHLLGGMLLVSRTGGSPRDRFLAESMDRAADAFVLVGAGYSVDLFLPGGASLGWLAALLATFTAFVRVLGATFGVPQSFAGPMARQHRMFVITVGAIAAGIQNAIFRPGWAMVPALLLVVIGTGWTLARRSETIFRALVG